MVDELIPFGGPVYFLFFSFLSFALDGFFEHLDGDAEPCAGGEPARKKMGWRWGLIANGIICVWFGRWPLPAIVDRDHQSAGGRSKFPIRMANAIHGRAGVSNVDERPHPHYTSRIVFLCLGAQSSFYALLGAALVLFSDTRLVPFGIGVGMLTYSVAVAVYSTISVWRVRSR